MYSILRTNISIYSEYSSKPLTIINNNNNNYYYFIFTQPNYKFKLT